MYRGLDIDKIWLYAALSRSKTNRAYYTLIVEHHSNRFTYIRTGGTTNLISQSSGAPLISRNTSLDAVKAER